MRALVVALSCVALLAGAGHRLHAQEEIFEQGNQLYLEGDYAGAVEAYQAVLDAGFESVALHYNLGNAHFKTGELGRSILAWERARALAPNDPDVLANLDLALSQTADAIEPLPRFWLISAASWWVGLLPRGALIALVAAAWLIVGAGTWAALAGAGVVLVFGTNLLVRELGIGSAERGVILADAVPVRSAPADQDELTLFEIHEGTRVRIEERAGEWAEVVLEDGKVGWVPAEVLEEI
jgi:tetratricopeptide (TPR) repeat protein